MNRRAVLSLPLPCLAALTLACLTTHLHAEETSWSIIQVDESMLHSLLTPMSHLVTTHSIESTTMQDSSLGTPRAAVVRAVITHHHKTSTNQLNTDDHSPARKVEWPRAKDFAPTTPITIGYQQAITMPTSFAMIGR